ncbi:MULTISPECIES: DISARM system SNF2-like helicase DrmD [unclassified Modestobacter]|uniref:DISARM system SNF2-like helicase DrmD n=1 Tax=unclassified Modestobacter TaxID=2643866 RepID=UPI0022AA3D11|nr:MULTISPECIES: DISARM system SNF2-like helicase DrmD [unclassified Modestobacter]MCZ2826683.1 DISARM system SNF2-like helicase DrmD [Modestobacter sp. VKM Ac-2981]MCZ2855063.1 DISARM system SNF2-like helicase DrmD [Modestobacter sp. VKM Ac-2982]
MTRGLAVEENATGSVEGLEGANYLPPLPTPGQVVEVRGSTWAVANVRTQGLPRSPADETLAHLTHVVELQSLDEDRLGEQLSVVWELEVGHTVTPDQGLPERIRPDAFDDPTVLAGFIDAMRWGAVTSADPNRYQAPFWSGVNVEAYQLEPLRRALSAPRTNLLLADDVGLGKTIEAGLVIQELLLRHRARTVVIVCPPSLSLKWQDEMREKFGLDFTIVDSELMAEIRRSHGLHANPFTLFPRVIVSMAWLPQSRAQRLLRDVYSRTANPKSAKRFAFDIIVVDEAHHVAPASPSAVAGGRGYAVDTHRTVAVRELAEKCEHRLFLSATPHNGHPESFTALMEMIDPRRFSRGARLDAAALRDVTVRRLKTDLTDKGFQKRSVTALSYSPSAEEQSKFEVLDRIVRRSAELNGTRPGGDIVTMLLKKRFLSSPYAFGTTLSHYVAARAGAGLADDDYDDVFGEGRADDEEGLWEQDEATRLRDSKSSDPLSGAEPGQLEELAQWGRSHESKPDSRLERLVELLDAVCRPAGSWSNERVVVFTEYADTVDWLTRVLTQRGYADVLAVIQGSTPTEEREVLREQFNADPATEAVRVLLATDAAGEGIDLQKFCHRLVNFDIPFNPSRLEQRIGRIDRYGQTERPEVFHLVPDSTSSTYGADAQFLSMIGRKIAQVEYDLGSANQVVAGELARHFAGGRATKSKKKGLDGNQVIAQALAGSLTMNYRLTELEQGYSASRTAMHLSPANLRRVVDTALQINHQLPLIPNDDFVEDLDAEVFDVPALTAGWRPALRGLDTRRKPGILRPITFDPEATAGRDDLVYVHLGHPIVQKAQRSLRRSLWSADSPLNRVTAVVVDGLPESFVAAVTRMVLVGRGGLRLHEEVFLAGVRLRGRRVMAEDIAETALDTALDGGAFIAAERDLRVQLTGLWDADDGALRARLEQSMSQRAARRHTLVVEQLMKREAADVQRAQDIFAAFRTNLTESLSALEQVENDQQLSLLPDEQERQRRRDIDGMRRRLAELGDEEDREILAIRDRYAEVKPHTTAAAVVFALTPADARGVFA